jgi:hypothetical protein
MDALVEAEMIILRKRLRVLELQSGKLSEDAQSNRPESEFFGKK